MRDYDCSLIVKNIKNVMEKRGMNAREVAEVACVGKSFVYDVLNGKSCNPTAARLCSVAKALSVPFSSLVRGVGGEDHDYFDYDSYSSVSSTAKDIAGGPEFFVRNDLLRSLTNAPTNNSKIISHIIRDDCMSPTFQRGDVVMVDLGNKIPSPSGLFLIKDSNCNSVRRIEKIVNREGEYNVISDNGQYSNYTCLSKDVNILGRVIWYSRSL